MRFFSTSKQNCFSSSPYLFYKKPHQFFRDKNYFLKKLGLKPDSFDWPKTLDDKQPSADHWHFNPCDIDDMYGRSDLSKLPVFQGGYINFGCWRNNTLFPLNNKERLRSSELMYQMLGEAAQLDQQSRVVDLGCGLGFGCRYLFETFKPKQIIGVDINPTQIIRAKKHQGDLISNHPDRFQLIIGTADKMPFSDHSLSHIISVEAAQHFPSFENFVLESQRVLQPSGKLLFTTFYATSEEGKAALQALIPDATTHCSQLTKNEVESILSQYLTNVTMKSIGNDVYPGLEKWLRQIGYERQWTMLWPRLYKEGYIDYFVFEATAPELTLKPNVR